MSNEQDAIEAVGPDRRSFVKGLIATSVFAAPVVSSFTMSGVQSVFGAVPGSTAMGTNCNTSQPLPVAPPGFSTLVDSFIFYFVGQNYEMTDGATELLLHVDNFALPNCTRIHVYKADPVAMAALVPAGEVPVSGYAVVWTSPGGVVDPDALTPITLTVTNAPVAAGDTVYVFDKTSGLPVADTVATAGTWVVQFVVDPGYVVTQVAAAAPPTVADPTFTG